MDVASEAAKIEIRGSELHRELVKLLDVERDLEGEQRRRERAEQALAKMIDDVGGILDLAGSHYMEWGERAESCFEQLEQAVRSAKSRQPDVAVQRDS